MTIGIMSAMREEIDALLKHVKLIKTEEQGKRTYYFAEYKEHQLVLVFSRWGKVASASTATCLILKYKVDQIIFSGVAGALSEGLNIGDIVVGAKLYQHDLDPRPILSRFEIPLLSKIFLETNEKIRKGLYLASKHFLDKEVGSILEHSSFKDLSPKVLIGDIGTGDQFLNCKDKKEDLLKVLPSLNCVEMEGASVGQICYEYGIDFGIIRTISDSANQNAHLDFPKFINEIASEYTKGIILNYLQSLLLIH